MITIRISGAQGSGKTKIGDQITALLHTNGKAVMRFVEPTNVEQHVEHAMKNGADVCIIEEQHNGK